MKDLAANALFQCLACIALSVVCFVVAGRNPAASAQLNLAGAFLIGLGMRLPGGRSTPPGTTDRAPEIPPPAALLPLTFLVFFAGACGSNLAQRQIDVGALTAKAADELDVGIAGLKADQLRSCDALSNQMEQTICRMAVEEIWSKASASLAVLRVKTQDLKMTPEEFLDAFRDEYCALRAKAPPELVLPPVAGLACDGEVK